MSQVDITVLGAGVFGLSIAWACVDRGATVRVIDPNGPGAGASGGVLGALAPHMPDQWNSKKQFQLESLILAEPFWACVQTVSQMPTGYGRIGRIIPVRDEGALGLAQTRAENASTLWPRSYAWRVHKGCHIDLTLDHDGYVYDTLSARIHPTKAIAALAVGLNRRGVSIMREAPLSGRVIHATGVAGLDDLSAQMKCPIGNGVKGQAAVLACDLGDSPQFFVDGLHIVPHADGCTAIGSTTEPLYDDPRSTDDQLDQLIARARRVMPRLASAPVLARWADLRPRAKSRAPIIGAWPGRSGHYIANGGFKIGFGMAPKLADVICDLVLEDQDTIPSGFRLEDNLPSRKKL